MPLSVREQQRRDQAARGLARRQAASDVAQDRFLLKPPARVAGRLILWAPEARVRLSVRHAELPQVEQEAAGGWRTIPRSKRTPLTVWDGPESLRIRVVLFLDGWQEFPARSVDPDLRAVRTLSRKVDGLDRPPWLRAVGVVPYPGTRWVVERPQIVEEKHVRGRCVRARATLILLAFTDSEVDLRVERQRKIAAPRTHEWARGDTLQKLAKRYLADARRGPDIRAKNPAIRAWSRVRPGTKIKIPAG